MKKLIPIILFTIFLTSFTYAVELPTCSGFNSVLSAGDYTMSSDMNCDLTGASLGDKVFTDDNTNGDYTLDCEGHTITAYNGAVNVFASDYDSITFFEFTNNQNSINIQNCNFVFDDVNVYYTKENFGSIIFVDNNVTLTSTLSTFGTRAIGTGFYDSLTSATEISIINNSFTQTDSGEATLLFASGTTLPSTFEITGNAFHLTNVTKGFMEGGFDDGFGGFEDPLYLNGGGQGNYYNDDGDGYTCTDTTPDDGICDNSYTYDNGYYGVITDTQPLESDPFGSPACSEDWVCNGYASCGTDDEADCNSVTDNNACGTSYTGDYSEFTPQACDYCTPSFSCSGFGSCQTDDTQDCNSASDSNSCFAQTGLSSDQYSGDYTEFTPQACDYCTPSWGCDGYDSCLINDTQDCNSASDSNTCYFFTGLASDQYSGDYSEFPDGSCDFCTPDFVCDGYGECLPNSTQECNSESDNNNCFATTGLPSDDYSGDFSELLPQTQNCSYCANDWVCNGYEDCQINDSANCDSVIDNNLCGDSYTGDYSEFTPLVCDYCNANIVEYNSSTCIDDSQEVCYQDLNFATCCATTGLGSDCTQATEFECGNESCNSGYITAYATSDIPLMTIDGIAKVLLIFVGFASVIGLVAGYGYMSSRGLLKLK